MTEKYTPEKVAELVAEARTLARHSSISQKEHATAISDLADALAEVSAERDAALAKAENGSCWDEGPQMRTPGGCDPMPPRCELRAGHAGAHRGGSAEWMRNPSSYNHVAAERDRLHKAITEALAGAAKGDNRMSDVQRILHAALDKEGNDDE